MNSRKHKSRSSRSKTSSRKTTRPRQSSKKRRYDVNKKKHRPYLLYIILMGIFMYGLYQVAPDTIQIDFKMSEQQEERIRQIVQEEINNANTKAIEELQKVTANEIDNAQTEQVETPAPAETIVETPPISRGAEPRSPEPVINEDNILNGYRVTSYYPGDGYQTTSKTGSGKTTSDFDIMNIGGKRVYTYQGKIVVACATNALKKSGYSKKGSQNEQVKHYFNYGDTMILTINGQQYEAICLDSCGASMWEHYYRVDIFVPSSSDVINLYDTDIILQ